MKAGGIILKKNDSPAFFQSRLTDAVSVILSELLSYEHPPNRRGPFRAHPGLPPTPSQGRGSTPARTLDYCRPHGVAAAL